MFLYYKDQSIAEEVEHMLDYLRIPSEMECSCTKDRGLSQCLDMGSSCRGGVYLTVPEKYSTVLTILTEQIKEKQNR